MTIFLTFKILDQIQNCLDWQIDCIRDCNLVCRFILNNSPKQANWAHSKTGYSRWNKTGFIVDKAVNRPNTEKQMSNEGIILSFAWPNYRKLWPQTDECCKRSVFVIQSCSRSKKSKKDKKIKHVTEIKRLDSRSR